MGIPRLMGDRAEVTYAKLRRDEYLNKYPIGLR